MKRMLPGIGWKQGAYLALAGLALVNSGCLVVAAGAAAGGAVGYVYGRGKVCQNYVANSQETWAATHTALQELGIPVETEEYHADGGSIDSQLADGGSIRIYLDAAGSGVPPEGPLTTVCVRVAMFGDYDMSERILNQIGAHLAVAPTAASPGTIQPTAPPLPQTAPPPLLPPDSK